MDNVNWQQKYMDEHIKVQDLESKIDIYENITISRLKKLSDRANKRSNRIIRKPSSTHYGCYEENR